MIEKGENLMLRENRAFQHHNNNVFGVATGLFIGSMIGAVTMLFLAPQSGKRTRTQVQQKSLELRDKAGEVVEDTMAQVRLESKKLTRTGRQKARKLMHQGHDLLTEQVAHVSEVVGAGKKSLLGS
jgi:gas vesicle protein